MCIGQRPDTSNAAKIWHSQNHRRGKAWAAQNLGNGVDRLIEMGQHASDEKKRERIYRALHNRIYKLQPALFLYFPYVFNAVSSRIHGAESYLNSSYMSDHLIKDFYIAENKGMNTEGGDA